MRRDDLNNEITATVLLLGIIGITAAALWWALAE